MTTQTVVIWGPNCPFTDATFHVHAAGCADLNKGVYRRLHAKSDQGGYTEEHSSQQSVVESFYENQIDESNGSWDEDAYLGDFHFFPCVTLPVAEPVEDEAWSSDHDHEFEGGDGEGPCTDKCVALHPDHAGSRGEEEQTLLVLTTTEEFGRSVTVRDSRDDVVILVNDKEFAKFKIDKARKVARDIETCVQRILVNTGVVRP